MGIREKRLQQESEGRCEMSETGDGSLFHFVVDRGDVPRLTVFRYKK